MKIINDSHNCSITCTRWQCESNSLKDNAIDAGTNATLDVSKARGSAEEKLQAWRDRRDTLLESHKPPVVSKARSSTTMRVGPNGAILLPPRGKTSSKRSNSQRKGSKKVVFVNGVLGVGGINNKNIGTVRVKTKDYSGY